MCTLKTSRDQIYFIIHIFSYIIFDLIQTEEDCNLFKLNKYKPLSYSKTLPRIYMTLINMLIDNNNGTIFQIKLLKSYRLKQQIN